MPTYQIKALYLPTETVEADTEPEARAAYHEAHPGLIGTIWKVEALEDAGVGS